MVKHCIYTPGSEPGVGLLIGLRHSQSFYVKVFLYDGQGADRPAILSCDRSCCRCLNFLMFFFAVLNFKCYRWIANLKLT